MFGDLLVQLGQGRDGLYSYERLENLVGCDMHKTDPINFVMERKMLQGIKTRAEAAL